jgi:acetolactate synthase regulatory subunit
MNVPVMDIRVVRVTMRQRGMHVKMAMAATPASSE